MSAARTIASPGERRVPSVLVMTHSHPKLTRGGAEISAFTLFRELKARGGKAWLLGCSSPKSEARLGATLTQPYGPDDYVYHPNAPFDYFKFANPDPQFPKVIEELVAELKPDIVHSHHFVRFGVEMFAAIRRGWPQAKIVLSLHEYLAICNHHGQMMKTVSFRLCEKETTAACAACFPQYGERDFFLRKRYLQMFFADVDLFISPATSWPSGSAPGACRTPGWRCWRTCRRTAPAARSPSSGTSGRRRGPARQAAGQAWPSATGRGRCGRRCSRPAPPLLSPPLSRQPATPPPDRAGRPRPGRSRSASSDRCRRSRASPC